MYFSPPHALAGRFVVVPGEAFVQGFLGKPNDGAPPRCTVCPAGRALQVRAAPDPFLPLSYRCSDHAAALIHAVQQDSTRSMASNAATNPAAVIVDARDSVDRSFEALFRARASQPVAAPLRVGLLLGDTRLVLGSRSREAGRLGGFLLRNVTRLSAQIVRLELQPADASVPISIPWFRARLASAVGPWSYTLLVALPASDRSRRFVGTAGAAGYRVLVGRHELLVAYAVDVSPTVQRLVLRERPRFRLGYRARLQQDVSAGQMTVNVSFEELPRLQKPGVLPPLEQPTVVFRSVGDERVSVHRLAAVISAGVWALDSVLLSNFDSSSQVDILEQSSDVMDVVPIIRIESLSSGDALLDASASPRLLDATVALVTVPEDIFHGSLLAMMCPNISVPQMRQSISATDEVTENRASSTPRCELLLLQGGACLDPTANSGPKRKDEPTCSKVMPPTLQSSFVHRIAVNNKWRIVYADDDMQNRHNIIDTTVLYHFFSDKSPAQAEMALLPSDSLVPPELRQIFPKKLVYGSGAGSPPYESFSSTFAAALPTLIDSVRLQLDSIAPDGILHGKSAGIAELWPERPADVRALLQQFQDVELQWNKDAIGALSDGQLELIPGQVYTMKATITILPQLERAPLGTLALKRWTITQHSKSVFRQDNTDPAMRNVAQIRYVIKVEEDTHASVTSLRWTYAEFFVHNGGIAIFGLVGHLLLRCFLKLRALLPKRIAKATRDEMDEILHAEDAVEQIRRMSS